MDNYKLGGQGTIKLTGFSGYSATAAPPMAAIATASAPPKSVLSFIFCLPVNILLVGSLFEPLVLIQIDRWLVFLSTRLKAKP